MWMQTTHLQRLICKHQALHLYECVCMCVHSMSVQSSRNHSAHSNLHRAPITDPHTLTLTSARWIELKKHATHFIKRFLWLHKCLSHFSLYIYRVITMVGWQPHSCDQIDGNLEENFSKYAIRMNFDFSTKFRIRNNLFGWRKVQWFSFWNIRRPLLIPRTSPWSLVRIKALTKISF